MKKKLKSRKKYEQTQLWDFQPQKKLYINIYKYISLPYVMERLCFLLVKSLVLIQVFCVFFFFFSHLL